MSKHTLVGGDGRKLLDLLARLKTRAEQRIAAPVKVVAIHEVGLDGFWIHRLLEANGVESHVVDPASIAVPRRHRRAKTDAIDGETLLRTLMAWQRGEPRVCAMTVPPSPSEEDCRRVSRERATLLRERIQHTNRKLDPTSSRGVLKAMLSGIAAAHLIDGVLAGTLPAANAAAVYQSWLTEWFTNDAAHLSAFYRDIRMRGFGPALEIRHGRH